MLLWLCKGVLNMCAWTNIGRHRNNHKPTDKMQRISLISLPHQTRHPRAASRQRCRHCWVWSILKVLPLRSLSPGCQAVFCPPLPRLSPRKIGSHQPSQEGLSCPTWVVFYNLMKSPAWRIFNLKKKPQQQSLYKQHIIWLHFIAECDV